MGVRKDLGLPNALQRATEDQLASAIKRLRVSVTWDIEADAQRGPTKPGFRKIPIPAALLPDLFIVTRWHFSTLKVELSNKQARSLGRYIGSKDSLDREKYEGKISAILSAYDNQSGKVVFSPDDMARMEKYIKGSAEATEALKTTGHNMKHDSLGDLQDALQKIETDWIRLSKP